MPFPISKTNTAVGMKRYGITLNPNQDMSVIAVTQKYMFVDASGQGAMDIQKFSTIDTSVAWAEIPTEIQTSLTQIWDWLEVLIKQQEGL